MASKNLFLPALFLGLACIAHAADPAELFIRHQAEHLADYGRQEQESHLRLLTAEHPAQASLHFRLGNLLADQQRWPEARLAYQTALAKQADHPDLHHNLAIALDHLEQLPAAIHHYRAALQASQNHQYRFLPEAVLRRLQQIETPQP